MDHHRTKWSPLVADWRLQLLDADLPESRLNPWSVIKKDLQADASCQTSRIFVRIGEVDNGHPIEYMGQATSFGADPQIVPFPLAINRLQAFFVDEVSFQIGWVIPG